MEDTLGLYILLLFVLGFLWYFILLRVKKNK